MRVAALDLGSNTFLLLVADVKDGRVNKVLCDELTVTRLGEGVHKNREFSPQALERAQRCLEHYSQLIKKYKCERVLAVSTSAARHVKNGHQLLELGKRLQIPIAIIDGQKEAELTFLGSTMDVETKNPVVVDVGGGSTELVGRATDQARQIKGHSFDIGSVRLTEMFVKSDPIGAEEITAIEKYAKKALQDWETESLQLEELVAVAGTPTTLAAIDQKIDYEPDNIDGYVLSLSRLVHLRDELAALTLKQRQKIKGMDPKRADVIVAGTTILIAACQRLGCDHLTVSVKGVRYGVASRAEEWVF